MANHTEEFILGLRLFAKVEKALGYNNAVYELGRVVRIDNKSLGEAFIWQETVQGHYFWRRVSNGRTRFKAGD